MDRPNQDKIRKLGKKETYKNLAILETETINGNEKKNEESVSQKKQKATWDKTI